MVALTQNFFSRIMLGFLVEGHIYNEKYFSDDYFSYNNSPCHYMRAWIHILDAPSCYERAAQAERKSTLQGSGLVRIVRPCAQRKVALMFRDLATARDALSNDGRESTVCLILRGLFLVIPVSSPVVTFEQSENVAIAHLVGARAVACYKGCGLYNRFNLRMRTVLMGNLAQAGYCLYTNYVFMFCEHVLLIDNHSC